MKMTLSIIFALNFITMGSIAVVPANVYAADESAGKEKSAMCIGCHGTVGISANPEWPNLAGQKEKYIMKQLKAFRSGTRKNSLMAPIAAALSDEDIENLAAYFSRLE